MRGKLPICILLLAAFEAKATNGYFSHGYGLISKAEGGTGIALGRDALTIATNPAGLTEAQEGFEFGVDVFAPKRGAELLQGGGKESFDGDDTEHFFIPEAGYSRHVNERVAVGVALFGNGGMNTDYQENPFARFGATGSAGVDLSQAFISPAIAVKLGDSQSIGLAVNLAYQKFEAKGVGIFSAFSADPAHVSNQGYDDSTGWGVRLGWQGHFGEHLKLGATWQSKTHMGEFDKYRGLFADAGDFDIPENYGLGIALLPSPSVTLALDWQKILYSGVPAVGNPINSLFAGVPLGADNGPGLGWRDVSIWKIGAGFRISDSVTLHAGASTSRQPIPASQTFFNILAPVWSRLMPRSAPRGS